MKQAGGSAAALVDVLTAQHERGREITAYILQVAKGSMEPGDVDPVACPTNSCTKWASGSRDVERQTVGHGGFEDAVNQIAQIEKSLGLADLTKFTAPPPKT